MRGPSPSPANVRGSAIVTSRARSRPTMLGSAAIRSRASASLISPGKTPPRIAPASRMWRTSARVSTPSMPGIPLSRSQSSQPCSAPGRAGLVDRGAHDRRAGVDAVGLHARRADAVVADVRVGERDQLAREARVAHRLLVARHAGREDDLAGHRAGRPDGVAVEARPVLEEHVRRRSGGRSGRTPARGRRPSRRRRWRAPCRAASARRSSSSPSGSRSRPRRPPTPPRGRSGTGRPGARPRSAAARGRTAPRRPTASRPPARAAARPGTTSSVWTAANAVSSPVVPIGASSHGTSFSSRACGAWSVAMQSIVPSRRPSISAWRSASPRSGGFIFSRVSSERGEHVVRRSARGGAATPRR